MNTGERLTELSGLSPRSAFDHFMAIVTGGVNKTIFASQMTVSVDTPQLTIVKRAKTRDLTPTSQPKQRANGNGGKRVDVLVPGQSITVMTGEESMFVVTQTSRTAVTTRTPTESILVNHKKVVRG